VTTVVDNHIGYYIGDSGWQYDTPDITQVSDKHKPIWEGCFVAWCWQSEREVGRPVPYPITKPQGFLTAD